MLLDPQTQAAELHTALRLVSHHHVVAEIFAAHLGGTRHNHLSDNTVETAMLADLRASVATDRWYQHYVRDVAADHLDKAIAFTFTDGDRGSMTRREMLQHVALHSAIHRGEVSRILAQLSITPPWDTLAVYLHRTQPARRGHRNELLPAGLNSETIADLA